MSSSIESYSVSILICIVNCDHLNATEEVLQIAELGMKSQKFLLLLGDYKSSSYESARLVFSLFSQRLDKGDEEGKDGPFKYDHFFGLTLFDSPRLQIQTMSSCLWSTPKQFPIE